MATGAAKATKYTHALALIRVKGLLGNANIGGATDILWRFSVISTCEVSPEDLRKFDVMINLNHLFRSEEPSLGYERI